MPKIKEKHITFYPPSLFSMGATAWSFIALKAVANFVALPPTSPASYSIKYLSIAIGLLVNVSYKEMEYSVDSSPSSYYKIDTICKLTMQSAANSKQNMLQREVCDNYFNQTEQALKMLCLIGDNKELCESS